MGVSSMLTAIWVSMSLGGRRGRGSRGLETGDGVGGGEGRWVRGVGRINEVYAHDVLSMPIRILSGLFRTILDVFDYLCASMVYDQSSMNFLVALYTS